MKKFHKRAAVFLTAATLAGLPAGAFFYSSPGSLTVWADNVEVESSEESSPEDVDFSDGSEVEIHADPVEQAQEDAGNDVTETPEVGITFTEPEGWLVDRTGIRTSVARKTVGIITIHFCTINRPVRRHLVLTYFYKFIPVTFGHVNVHIIVPWDKAFISKNTDQSTSGHYISKIMLFADRVNLPEELQKKLLFFCHLSTSLINYFQKLSQSF